MRQSAAKIKYYITIFEYFITFNDYRKGIYNRNIIVSN